LSTDDLLAAVREEFKENEDLPNTTHPDDWAKIACPSPKPRAAAKWLISRP